MMPEADLNALAADIAGHGLQEPIVTYEGKILDGRNRYVACFMQDIEPEYTEYGGDDPLGYVISLNLHRRHLTSSQRAAIAIEAGELVGRLEEEAKERQGTRTDLDLFQRFEKGEPRHTAKTVAGLFDTNIQYYQDAKRIKQEAPELLEQVRTGEMNIPQARREIVRREREALPEPPPLPQGKYRCIVIDPPWPMKRIEREVRPNQPQELDYPVMTLAEIEALPIASLADESGCHVYLWTTHKYLPAALGLFESWGVKYQCLMTWVKPTGMTPYSWMYNTEHVLFGRIGSLRLDRLGLKLAFSAPAVRHSQKPDVFYELAAEASPEPRLELFARREREGFTVWGNEVS